MSIKYGIKLRPLRGLGVYSNSIFSVAIYLQTRTKDLLVLLLLPQRLVLIHLATSLDAYFTSGRYVVRVWGTQVTNLVGIAELKTMFGVSPVGVRGYVGKRSNIQARR